MIRAGLPDSVIIQSCLDERYRGKGIYQHIVDNGGRQCAERQLQRAHEKIIESRSGNRNHTWEHPDLSILDEQRGELPTFPVDTLQPKSVQDWAASTALSTGTTIDHVAVPLIGVAASLIGNARGVRAGSFLQPATLWAFIIGYSGTGKTPGFDVWAREPLVTIEKMREADATTRLSAGGPAAARATRLSTRKRFEGSESRIKVFGLQ